MTRDVFISYSTQDQSAADCVRQILESSGMACWIAPRDIMPSETWAASIVRAIENCQVMVLICSSHSNESRQVARELQLADNQKVPVIPFRLEDAEPSDEMKYFLENTQWLNAYPEPVDSYGDRLVGAVRELLTPKPVPATPEPPAVKRQRSGIDDSARRPDTGPAHWLFVVAAVLIALLIAFFGLRIFRHPVRTAAHSHPRPAVTVRQNPKDAQNYVHVPAGSFEMGCAPEMPDCRPSSQPRHRVGISHAFWLGENEATVSAYKKFVEETRHPMPAAPAFNPDWSVGSHPVVNISWGAAASFCSWAGGRLPTEAEWEYAARAGDPGLASSADVAWLPDNSGGHPHDVRQKEPNAFGLYDMVGNVWEFTADWFRRGYYVESPAVDPPGAETGRSHVLRGGSWNAVARPWSRLAPQADESNNQQGFRCAIDALR